MCVCVTAGLSFWSNSQNLTTVHVIQEINYSSIHLYIFENVQTQNYYKSSASTADILDIGNEVQLDLTHENSNIPIYINESLSNLIALEIQGSNNDDEGGFNLTDDIIYNLPYQVDDILFFENSQHITDLTELLYGQEDIDIENNENLQDSSILFAFEGQYTSFKSFRHHIENRYAFQESEGYLDDELKEYYKYDHLKDDALKSFFNENRLIGIGDSVYYYHNTNEALRFHMNFTEGYTICRKLSLLDKYENTLDHFRGTLLIHPGFEEISEVYDPNRPKGSITLTDPNNPDKKIVHESKLHADHPPALCENTTIRIWLSILATELEYIDQSVFPPKDFPKKEYPVNLKNRPVTLEIKWKGASSIGSDIQTITNYKGGKVSHDYGIAGSHNIITKITYVDTVTLNIAELNDNINSSVTGLPCTTSEDWDYDFSKSGNSNGDWRLEAEIWTRNKWFGKQIGSHSHAYERIRGKWKRRRITINTYVYGRYRDDQCIDQNDPRSDYKSQNSRKVRVTETPLLVNWSEYAFGNDTDLWSRHRMDSKGLDFKIKMTLCQ